ncbi:SDR family NAD(P)-dependent oxidoreductase [Pseudogracilibacillus sp. SO30301A]|uniref:SDR family NAD(P)-dependent oxidoreductase n=1 Tax=Pseudogracilibacillus sp. SO30301A TaxID=3098291 RepID=UPI00300DC046
MDIFSKESMNGKHILITGATGGIGYETAKVLASMGASISLTGRNEIVLKELKEELLSITQSNKIFTQVADLTNDSERTSLIESCQKQHGDIYGLVNSAAISAGDVVEKLKKDDVINIMNINFISTLMLTQMVYKKMLKRREGNIVNVSSLSGIRGSFANTPYAASKFALIGFTQSMALEAIKSNIRVNAVCPGYVDTKMGREGIKRKALLKGVPFEEYLKTIENSIPSGRITKPKEVANTIAFLLTEASTNIVGESLKISGGSVL